MIQPEISRRNFVKGTTAGVAASVATLKNAASSVRAAGSNERLRIGVIGAGNRGFNALTKRLVGLRKKGRNIDLVSVADVYSVHRQRFVDYIKEQTGLTPKTYVDHQELLAQKDIDAVVIATPDHWHAKITIDALKAGKDVYCEKPMTHTVAQAKQVVNTWKSSGRILQVGVQSSSSPVWDMAREMITSGKLGKIVQFQTECFRNGRMGMSRHNKITKEMTPKTVDFKRFLGVEEGFHEEVPFDREIFGQWRCYWAFGYGMYSDLFVHRVTGMLKATGLRSPGRVVGGGGIFMEYDNREVTDVASIIADYHEAVQGVVSSTMVSEVLKLNHLIRGHFGTLLFDKPCFLNGPKASRSRWGCLWCV